ncbi:MAG: preprotein translocase subunit SecY, partial [Methylobacterium sp.]
MASAAEQLAANLNFGALAKAEELKKRIWFTLGALLVYRLGTYIPLPGINPESLADIFKQQQAGVLGLFNMFSGGAVGRLAIFALNIMPYISASIIIQLMTTVSPTLEALKKEGEAGRRQLNQYTRYLTLVLALFQAWGIAVGLQSSGGVVLNPGPFFVLATVITLTGGTLFLMWLGEQITSRGIGNGTSLIIFAGIVAGLPSAMIGTLQQVSSGDISVFAIFVIIALVLGVTYFVVFMERGQRRITVNYARRQGGRQAYMNQSSHLPLKLNMSGVIPAIFASSLILFPATISTWMSTDAAQAEGWRGMLFRGLQSVAQALAPNEPLHMLLYGALILGFAFFYTALVF